MTTPVTRGLLPPTPDSSARSSLWAHRHRRNRKRLSILIGVVARVVTIATVALVPVLLVALVLRSWSLLSAKPVLELFLGTIWLPTDGQFGFAPFLAASVWVTALSLVIAVPLSILGASYLAEYARPETRDWVKPLVELLAGIPSVVFGLWGLLVIVPAVRYVALHLRVANTTGYSVLAASLVLSIMVTPFLFSLSEEVFRTVPQGAREAALSLGATRWETTRDVVWKQTRRGILAVVVLSFGRAFGETLAVLMVVGNVPKIPLSPLDAGYPLPALIANNFGEMMSVPLYDAALMMAALVLLVIVVLFNVVARLTLWRLERHEG